MGSILKQYRWLANILVILICSYFLAKIVNVYIGKSLEVRRTIGVMKQAETASEKSKRKQLSDYEIIVERNIFDSSEATPDANTGTGEDGEDSGDEIDLSKEAVKTSLPIKVFAVFVVGRGEDERSSATIEMNKETDVYAVKDEKTFAPGVVLIRVMPDRIEFTNKKRLEYAMLEGEDGKSIFGPPTDDGKVAEKTEPKDATNDSGSSVAVEDGKFLIDRSEVDNALNNLAQLYTEIRAVPYFKGGKSQGMRILQIKPGSIFSKLGMKKGDILTRINGIDLDIKKGFGIFEQLRDQKQFNLDLIRGGITQTQEYEIR